MGDLGKTRHAYVLLANGFEEIEAIAPLDILRRAGVTVSLLGVGGEDITSARGLRIRVDAPLITLPEQLPDMLILPGGEPGTSNLEHHDLVKELILKQHHAQRWIAAICAAPRILNALGILHNRDATSFPATEVQMTDCRYRHDPVVICDHIITSRGAGTALPFAYTLVSALCSPELSTQLQQSMVYCHVSGT